jgi:hypothetical protein
MLKLLHLLPQLQRKLKLADWIAWSHHRSGWKYVLSGLRRLHHGNGTFFHPFLDGFLRKNYTNEPWVGFLHNVPHHPQHVDKYKIHPGVSDLIQTRRWEKNYPYCLGIFTVSQHLKSFLNQHLDVPVSAIKHPIAFPNINFSYEKFINNQNKILLMTGHWMRRFESFYVLNADGYEKQILKCPGFDISHLQAELGKLCIDLKFPQLMGGVSIIPYVTNEEYDLLHEENIVFLDLYNVAACNTILDCLARNTPLLIRKSAGAIEYLGNDYPFYYETLLEAKEKLQDFDLIRMTHEYLVQLDKTDLQLDYFVNQMVQSEVYQNLPSPKYAN